MSNEPAGANGQSLAVDRLLAQFTNRAAAGEILNIEEFIKENPEHAVELRQHFRNVDLQKGQDGTQPPDVPETILKSDIDSDQLSDEANANTVVRGGTDSETSVTGPHRKNSGGSETHLEIPESFGRYAIQKILGQGAMGSVYLARDTQLDRDVALKIPKFGDMNGVDDEELQERFYREARAAATLRSPNICPVYDVGEIEGQHYITMAYIEGRPLKDFTKSKKKHSEKQIITTIRKLAMGLAEAHSIGVIHRDLKPANIMVDLKSEPVVMDFGLARRSSSDDVQVTQSGAILGTPAYMAPEQVAGDQAAINHQVDIYALGVIMYELITNEMPFKGNLMAILQQIALNNPTKPTDLRPDIDPRLEKICLKMMAGDQKQRYQSMNDVAAALQDVLKHPNRKQKQEAAKKTGPKPASIPTANDESNPALISVEQTQSYAEQLRKHKGKSRKPPKSSSKLSTRNSSDTSNTFKTKTMIAGGVGGLLLLLGIVFLVRVGKYDVQIELEDPSITLSVDGEKVVIDDDGKTIKLSSGKHKLKLEKDGLTTHVEEFTVTKDGKTALRAVVLNNKLDALLNGEKLPAMEIAKAKQSVSEVVSKVNLKTVLEFDGLDDYVTVPSIKYDGKTPLTIEVRLRSELPINSQIIKIQDETNPSLYLGWYINNDPVFTFYNHHLTGTDYVKASEFWDGRPTYIAAVIDPENNVTRMFIDGRELSSTSSDSHIAPSRRTGMSIGAELIPDPIHNFKGVIEEVRLTQSALYDKDYVPPASFESSSDTLALYKFDEGKGNILNDSSGNGHHGKIIGAKWVKDGGAAKSEPPVVDSGAYPGKFALSFPEREASHVDIPTLNSVLMNELFRNKNVNLTIEFWLNRDRNKISAHDHYAGWSDSYLFVRSAAGGAYVDGGEWGGRGAPPVGFYNTAAPTRTLKNEATWTHVAAVLVNPTECRLFIDGKLVDKKAAEWDWQGTNGPFQLMAQAAGLMGETRVSTTARYEKDFTPEFGFKADEHTLALYHFDEGTGNVLKDSSGNGHDGKIFGAKWVKVAGGNLARQNTATSLLDQRGMIFDSPETYAIVEELGMNLSEPFTCEMWTQPFDIKEPMPRFSRQAFRFGPVSFVNHHGPNHEEARWQLILSGDLTNTPHSDIKLAYIGQKSMVDTKNQRQHVALQWTDGLFTLYVDGQHQDYHVLAPGPVLLPPEDIMKAFLSVNTSSKLELSHVSLPNRHPYHGVIEQFRVSKGVRYQANFTPTQLSADSSTVALFNFDRRKDDILKDSSGNGHDGKIFGAKWVKTAEDSESTISGLRFDKNENVSITGFPEWEAEAFTFEAILTVEKMTGSIISSSGAYLAIAPTNVYLKVADGTEVNTRDFPLGAPVHIAAIYDKGEMLIFADGKLKERKSINAFKSKFIEFHFGDHGFKGTLHEVRISTSARYHQEFTPPAPDQNLAADEKTFALYHFDKDTGNILIDSSGNGHDGKISGAKWVGVEAVLSSDQVDTD